MKGSLAQLGTPVYNTGDISACNQTPLGICGKS